MEFAPGSCIHMVWFKFPTAPERAAEVEAALAALRDLAGKIDEIVSITCGPNFTTRTPFNYGLLVVLKSKEALPVYSDHPAHQRVVKEFIRPLVSDPKEDITALDYVV